MKKLLKGLTCLIMAFVLVFSLSACKSNLSPTTVDTSKVKTSNGVTTNGGITAIHDGYLYFINGTKTNDGKSPYGNTKSAICRVKFDEVLGTVNDATYEVVVDDLVGFTYGSLHFFGDFLYYTTPSADVNYKNNVLYYKTKFVRYDLVNKTKQTIYTTQQNAEKEEVSFAYYVVGEELDLIVYESKNASITSIKIGDTCQTNYVLNEVTSCALSENYGKCVTSGKTADANTFVFYTKAYDTYEKFNTGNKLYRTLPNKNSSTCIFNQGKEVTLDTIKQGKLIFSEKELDVTRVYAYPITGDANETISLDERAYVISYNAIDNSIYMENSDGSISIIEYKAGSDNSYTINKIDVSRNYEPESKQITYGKTKISKFTIAGLVKVNEIVKEATETEEAQTEQVLYLVYVADNALYKLEIERAGVLNENAKAPVKLTKSKIVEPSGLLLPEVVGNYVFAFANEIDDKEKETGNVYLHKIDLTIKETSKTFSPVLAIKED